MASRGGAGGRGGRGGFRGGRFGGGNRDLAPMGELTFKDLEEAQKRPATNNGPYLDLKTQVSLEGVYDKQEAQDVRRRLKLRTELRHSEYWLTDESHAQGNKGSAGSSGFAGESFKSIEMHKAVFPVVAWKSFMEGEIRKQERREQRRIRGRNKHIDWSKFESDPSGAGRGDTTDNRGTGAGLSDEEDVQGDYEDDVEDDYAQNYFDNGEEERDDLGDDMGGGGEDGGVYD